MQEGFGWFFRYRKGAEKKLVNCSFFEYNNLKVISLLNIKTIWGGIPVGQILQGQGKTYGSKGTRLIGFISCCG